MNISSIKQNLEHIDYAWNKPQTYLVFVPGLSLVIQKIQLANTLPKLRNMLPLTEAIKSPDDLQANDAIARKFATICKWHLRGSMIQLMVSVIAIKFFAIPLFSLFGVLAAYELGDTLIKSLQNRIELYEFYPNGRPKSILSGSGACNIF